MPAGKEVTRGIQFWINLEKKLKTIEPSYQLVAAEEIPVLDFDGGSRTIIVGEGSPVKLQNDISYEYISLDNGASYKLEGIGGLHGLIYLLSGKLEVGKEMLEDAQSLLFDGDNKSLLIKAHTESRFMLASGRPHCEPIRQFGPYVD
jgi:redox-sensitive bicupin YhaK (pirin superfamily)